MVELRAESGPGCGRLHTKAADGTEITAGRLGGAARKLLEANSASLCSSLNRFAGKKMCQCYIRSSGFVTTVGCWVCVFQENLLCRLLILHHHRHLPQRHVNLLCFDYLFWTSEVNALFILAFSRWMMPLFMLFLPPFSGNLLSGLCPKRTKSPVCIIPIFNVNKYLHQTFIQLMVIITDQYLPSHRDSVVFFAPFFVFLSSNPGMINALSSTDT